MLFDFLGEGVYKQGLKLTVASSKFAIGKSHLVPAKSVGSKSLLPGKYPNVLKYWDT